jgi:alpha-amylase
VYTINTAGFTVYFKKPTAWATPVKIHYWNVLPAGALAATTWPGVDMTAEGTDWYKFTFPSNVTSSNLIFNGNGSTTNKTPDLTRNKNGWYDNGVWYDTDPRLVSGLKIHLKTTWTAPRIYFWNATPGTATTTWPGAAMTSEGNGWYVYTIAGASCANIIFSNNGATQTADLYRCNEGWYNNGVWTSTMPSGRSATNSETILTEDPDGFTIHHFPNPVSDQSTIVFSLNKTSDVNLQLYDGQGKQIQVLLDDVREAGTHAVEMNATPLRAGLYTIRLIVNKKSVNRRVVIVH